MIFTISTLSNTQQPAHFFFLIFSINYKNCELKWTWPIVQVLCNYSVCSMSSEVPNVDYDKPFYTKHFLHRLVYNSLCVCVANSLYHG